MKIFEIIGTIIIMLGIILVYDARTISKKLFSSADQNVATLILKIVGFSMFIIGGLLIMFLNN